MAESGEKKQPTPADEERLRTGRCFVCRCEAYEHDRHVDGFRTCVCHHTQWGHRPPDAPVPAEYRGVAVK